MAGRKPKYDTILLNLKRGQMITRIDGLPITEYQGQAIRKRSKVLGIDVEFHTIDGEKMFNKVGK